MKKRANDPLGRVFDTFICETLSDNPIEKETVHVEVLGQIFREQYVPRKGTYDKYDHAEEFGEALVRIGVMIQRQAKYGIEYTYDNGLTTFGRSREDLETRDKG